MRRLLPGLLLMIAATAWSQDKVYLSGFVNDAHTLQALSYVNISQKGKVLASTDSNGSFGLSVAKQDTIVFTRLGYQPLVYVVSENNWDERIFMTEMTKVLDEIVIHDRYIIHGDDQIQKSIRDGAPTKFDNFTMTPQNQDKMVQTFGPSVTLGAPWDKWTKDAREQKALRITLSEQEKTAVYQQFIHSMVVEQYIIDNFNLDHDTYMKYKEGFIVANPDARYLKSRRDIIDLMVAYFASRK